MIWRQERHAFMMISLLLVLISGCKSAPPMLVVDTQVLDFGYVPRDGKDFEIPLRNEGQGKLYIYEVSTSCACTVVKAPEVIRPGENQSLVIKPPPRRSGPNSARVLVKSNDPNSPHEVYLTWFAESPPSLNPPAIVDHSVAPGSVIEREVKLSWDGGDARTALQIKSVETSNPIFEIEYGRNRPMAKVSRDGLEDWRGVVGETALYVRCRAPMAAGEVKGSCSITVAQAGQDFVLTLPIDLHVVGPIVPAPSRLFISAGNVKDLVGKKGQVLLRVSGSGEPRIVEKPDLLRHTIRELGANHRERTYLLEVEVMKPPSRAKSEHKLVLQNGSNAQSQVTVSVDLFAPE